MRASQATRYVAMSKPPPKARRKVSPLGVNLRRVRERAGIQQSELAERAGVSRVTVARLETGAVGWARPDVVAKLAAAVGATKSDLESGEVFSTDSGELVEEYLVSPYAQIDKPSDEELRWMRSLPGLVWLGLPKPTAETIHHMLLALRSGRVLSH
jgi:transcriptional regulator with XRE-family HTH domain